MKRNAKERRRGLRCCTSPGEIDRLIDSMGWNNGRSGELWKSKDNDRDEETSSSQYGYSRKQ